MANHEGDIVLIRKYLNGELDARAMHRLEARAQDDPFLADAIEGYEKAGGNQQPALADLGKRLNQRVEEHKVKRLIPFRTLAIAASVLMVFTVGWLVLIKKPASAPPPIAAIVPAEKTPAAQPVAKETTAVAQLVAKALAPVIRSRSVVKAATAPEAAKAAAAPAIAEPTADVNIIANATAKKADTADATPLNELVVMNYKPAKKSDTLKQVNADKSTQYAARNISNTRVIQEQKLNSKATGVSSWPADVKMSAGGSQKFFLQGRVIDEIDGRPLPGVAVKAYGTTFGAVTDKNGNFSIPSDGVKRGIVASRLGYNTAKVNAGAAAEGDSLKTISLAPEDIPKEATLTNNAKNPSAAHPQIGWSKYDKYLNGASVSPDHQTGTVTLSFWVDKTGAISNMTVATSLSDDADKKAINLVKNGPKWVGNATGKPEQVELSINF